MKNSNKTGNKNILNLLSFFALAIVAVLIIINNLFPMVGIVIEGSFKNILSTVKDVFVLIVIGLCAYNFVAGKSKAWKIVFLVAVLLFVAGIILYWF